MSSGGGSKEETEGDEQDSVPLVDLKPYPCFKGSVRRPVSHSSKVLHKIERSLSYFNIVILIDILTEHLDLLRREKYDFSEAHRVGRFLGHNGAHRREGSKGTGAEAPGATPWRPISNSLEPRGASKSHQELSTVGFDRRSVAKQASLLTHGCYLEWQMHF